jgi:pyruvate,water dikinase
MRLIAQLAELSAIDVAVGGGKGANLGELTRAGVAVPAGFVVTAEAYAHFLETTGIKARMQPLIAGLDHNDNPTVERLTAEIRGLITGERLPDDLAEATTAAYADLGAGAVAVRSSATAEDLPDASFAGQQSTYLNVEGGEAVTEAILNCWASLFEPRAVHYRFQHGYDHMAVGIAVVVQRMVESERSGVMFTLNPITGDHHSMIVEACYGLGEAVVSGIVTPDMYIVDKATGAVLDRQVGAQEQEMMRKANPAPGEDPNEWLAVSFERRAKQKLTDEEIAEVSRIGVRIEEHFGRPQDIEWAFEGGQFYVVQARPVTASG